MVNLWKRSISITPTAGSAAPKRSGRGSRRPRRKNRHSTAPIASLQVRGVSFCDQPFSAGDEVVEHILLVVEHAASMPYLAVFTASPHIGGR